MNIAYIVSGIKRSVFFENTALYLKKAGLNVIYILTSNESDDLELFLKNEDITFIVIEFNSMWLYPIYVARMFTILKKFKIDIVHTHLTSANITGLLAAKFAGIKNRVYTEHSGEQLRMKWKNKIFNYIIKSNYTHVIATTNTVKQNLISIGYDSGKIYIIPLGFEINKIVNPDLDAVKKHLIKYNPYGKYPAIGVISRAIELKGVQYTITAFKKLLTKYPDALLLLFNFNDKDEHSDFLKHQLSLLPLPSYKIVSFENDIYNLYQIFDYFVHVPIDFNSEGFGQTYIEALTAGIPSVFTLSGIAVDFIEDNNNALVANYQDADSIYQKLLALITNKALSDNLVLNGRNSLARFYFEDYINSILSFYNAIKIQQ